MLGWADEIRSLGVRANAETATDAARAVELGAEGIGLCRTEHMFFDPHRIRSVREMILADDTPPVGLAAFAAAAIAKSDPVKTGIQGFIYDLRTAVLPFVFIFNLELLMISGVKANGEIIWIDDFLKIGWICLASLVAIFAFASALQGYFADECNWGERGVLMAVCIVSFRPSLVTEFTGGSRVLVQLAAMAVFAGLYFYQKKRKVAPEAVPGMA